MKGNWMCTIQQLFVCGGQGKNIISIKTRKSSCVNARFIPPVLYLNPILVGGQGIPILAGGYPFMGYPLLSQPQTAPGTRPVTGPRTSKQGYPHPYGRTDNCENIAFPRPFEMRELIICCCLDLSLLIIWEFSIKFFCGGWNGQI